MDMVRRFEDDRFYGRAIKALVGLLVLTVVGFGAYYYVDRYHSTTTPLVDREIARAEQMVKNDPSNPTTRVGLGNLYLRKGSYAAAITQYSEVLKIEDSNQGALSGLGLAFYKDGKLKESAAAFERMIETTKDSPPLQRTPAMASVRYYLGLNYAAQGDLARAEDELMLSLSIKRSDADAMVALAQIVDQRGRPEDAIKIYRSALLFVPKFPEAYQGLAKAYQAAGMATEATYAGAMVTLFKGDPDTAISRLEGVVQAKPDLAEAFYGLGAAYDKKGNKERAVEAFRKALALDPKHEPARVALLEQGVEPPANAVPAAGH